MLALALLSLHVRWRTRTQGDWAGGSGSVANGTPRGLPACSRPGWGHPASGNLVLHKPVPRGPCAGLSGKVKRNSEIELVRDLLLWGNVRGAGREGFCPRPFGGRACLHSIRWALYAVRRRPLVLACPYEFMSFALVGR